jgi:hypothetical protein
MNEHIIPILHINIDIWLICANNIPFNPMISSACSSLCGAKGCKAETVTPCSWGKHGYDMIWCQHGGYIGKIHCSWNMAKIWLTYSLNIVELLQTYCWKHQTQHENLKFPQLKQWWSLVRMIQNDQNVDSKENRSPKCRITMIERQARVMWGPILCLDQRS